MGGGFSNFFTQGIPNFFTKQLPGAFKSAGTGFYEHVLHPVYDKVIEPAYHKIIEPVVDKGGQILGKVADTAEHTLDNASKLQDAAVNAAGGIGSFLSNPLYIIIGGVIAVAIVSKVMNGRAAARG